MILDSRCTPWLLTRRTFLALGALAANARALPVLASSTRYRPKADVELLNGQEGWTIDVVRPEDMLVLTIAFVQLELSNDNPNPFRLQRRTSASPNQPSLIVLHFPPQSLSEQNFPGCPSATTLNNGLANRILSGPSRLSFIFDVPRDDAGNPGTIAYTLDEVLQSCEQFTQYLPAQGIVPSILQSALEFPQGMLLSFDAAPELKPKLYAERDPGFWTADLGDGTLRAVQILPDGNTSTDTGSLTATQKRCLVEKMVAPGSDAIVAKATELTALGAFTDLAYADTSPGPPDLTAAPDCREDVRQWLHRATLGRDQFVQVTYIVYHGAYRHKCLWVETIERKFDCGVAYLHKRYNTRVAEPVVSYNSGSEKDRATLRRLGFQQVELRVTQPGPQTAASLEESPDLYGAWFGIGGTYKHLLIPALPHPTLGLLEYEFEVIKTDLNGTVLPPVRSAAVFFNETVAADIVNGVIKSADPNVTGAAAAAQAIASLCNRQTGNLIDTAGKLNVVGDLTNSGLDGSISSGGPIRQHVPTLSDLTAAVDVGQVYLLDPNTQILVRCIRAGAPLTDQQLESAKRSIADGIGTYDVIAALDNSGAAFEVLPAAIECNFKHEATIVTDDLTSYAKGEGWANADLGTLYLHSATFGPSDDGKITQDDLNAGNLTSWFTPSLNVARARVQQLGALCGEARRAYISFTDDYYKDAAVTSSVFAKGCAVTLPVLQDVAAAQLSITNATQALADNLKNSVQEQALLPLSSELQSLSMAAGPILGKIGQAADALKRFDPRNLLGDALNGAKLFNIFSLQDILDAVDLDPKNIQNAFPHTTISRNGATYTVAYRYTPNLTKFTGAGADGITLKPLNDPNTPVGAVLAIDVSGTVGGAVSRSLTITLSNFALDVLDICIVKFSTLKLTSTTGSNVDVDVKLAGVELQKGLSFLQQLESYLHPDTGPHIDVDATGINLGYGVHFPDLPLGGLRISNLQFDLGAIVPIAAGGRTLGFSFGLASLQRKFNIAFGIFGGGGYFAFSYDGSSHTEAAVDVSVSAEMDLVVARGSLCVAAGLSLRNDDTTRQLGGFVTATGEVSVLDLISASLTFNAHFDYDFGSGYCNGSATLHVDISIAFFSIDVPVTLKFSIHVSGGAGGQAAARVAALAGARGPSPQQYARMTGSVMEPWLPAVFPTQSRWDAYCGAFA